MALLWKSELPDIAVRAHPHDLGAHPREPEIAVRPCSDEDVRWRHGKLRQCACWRDARNLWPSVNQMLPSGPPVFPLGITVTGRDHAGCTIAVAEVTMSTQ